MFFLCWRLQNPQKVKVGLAFPFLLGILQSATLKVKKKHPVSFASYKGKSLHYIPAGPSFPYWKLYIINSAECVSLRYFILCFVRSSLIQLLWSTRDQAWFFRFSVVSAPVQDHFYRITSTMKYHIISCNTIQCHAIPNKLDTIPHNTYDDITVQSV